MEFCALTCTCSTVIFNQSEFDELKVIEIFENSYIFIMFFVELCNGKYSGPYYTVICCVGGRGESDRGHESIAGGGRNGVRTPQVTSPT